MVSTFAVPNFKKKKSFPMFKTYSFSPGFHSNLEKP